MMKKWLCALLILVLTCAALLTGCSELGIDAEDLLAIPDMLASMEYEQEIMPAGENETIREDGEYSSKSEVGRYLYLYGKLPSNYITKNEAYDLGWKSNGNTLWDVAPGMSIGGDKFGNREGLLPKGKQYYECDIDYNGGDRNAKRIVYALDGYIYYTDDHYASFEQLYP